MGTPTHPCPGCWHARAGEPIEFTTTDGASRHGRFHIRPDAETAYFATEDAAAQSEDFLVDEIGPRLAQEPVALGVFVQFKRSPAMASPMPYFLSGSRAGFFSAPLP